MSEVSRLPVTAQWSESRGFVRLYHNNPHYQARLAMALCGLRAEIIEKHSGDENVETVQIFDTAISEFAELHPEFLSPQSNDDELRMGAYEPDPLLLEHIERIVKRDE